MLQADQLIIGDRSGRRGGHSAGCGLNAGDLAGSAVDKLTLQLFGHGFSYLVDNKVHHIDVRVVLQLVGYQGQCTNHEAGQVDGGELADVVGQLSALVHIISLDVIGGVLAIHRHRQLAVGIDHISELQEGDHVPHRLDDAVGDGSGHDRAVIALRELDLTGTIFHRAVHNEVGKGLLLGGRALLHRHLMLFGGLR